MNKVYPIMFVLDCSGSMAGKPISMVNAVMKSLPEYLENSNNENVIIKVGILSFSMGAKWMTDGLIPIDELLFDEMQAGGSTDLGAALNILSQSLCREFFTTNSLDSIAKPVMIFMTDGQATDDWEKELEKFNRNLWVKHSARIAIGFNDSDEDCLLKLAAKETAFTIVENVEQVTCLLKVLFKNCIADGCSSLLSSPTEKASRIMRNSLEDDECLENDESY